MTFRIDVRAPADTGVAPIVALTPVPGAGNTQPTPDSGTDAVRTHEGKADPHPQYTTDAEAAVIAAAAVDDHEALVDPHPQYLTEAEGDARYVRDFFLDGGQPAEVFLLTQSLDGGGP